MEVIIKPEEHINIDRLSLKGLVVTFIMDTIKATYDKIGVMLKEGYFIDEDYFDNFNLLAEHAMELSDEVLKRMDYKHDVNLYKEFMDDYKLSLSVGDNIKLNYLSVIKLIEDTDCKIVNKITNDIINIKNIIPRVIEVEEEINSGIYNN